MVDLVCRLKNTEKTMTLKKSHCIFLISSLNFLLANLVNLAFHSVQKIVVNHGICSVQSMNFAATLECNLDIQHFMKFSTMSHVVF